jgi:hypothetical protein
MLLRWHESAKDVGPLEVRTVEGELRNYSCKRRSYPAWLDLILTREGL